MTNPLENAFEELPRDGRGHFRLFLYAAVYCLIDFIQRMSEIGGPELDKVYERYPFLTHYYAEMRRHMPASISWGQGIEWWSREISAWEEDAEAYLPLALLRDELGIELDACLALMLIGLIEEDSRFGTLFTEIQAPLPERRPSLELVARILSRDGDLAAGADPWGLCGQLLDAGLVEVMDGSLPRSEWILRVPAPLWDAARGGAPGSSHRPPDAFPLPADLIFPRAFIAQLDKLAELIAKGTVRCLVLRGDEGTDSLEIAGAVARGLGRGLLVEDRQGAHADDGDTRLLGPLCTMTTSMPVFRYDPGPGETVDVPVLRGYAGPSCLLIGMEGGVRDTGTGRTLTLTAPAPDQCLRVRYWRRGLEDRPVEDLELVGDRFQVSGGYIGQLAAMAAAQAELHARERVEIADIREAGRALNHQRLDTLAERLSGQVSWTHFVATESTAAKLRELQQRCRYRERLLGELGPAFQENTNTGVRALFTGASGTGKTLAAKILASELGMDLYRVDLAAVVNKYIGETEKNLHRVLSRAEALDIILLLDEGDALLGSRTDVTSANDRYANLETNYLLQRLEGYRGIALVTTNLVENIDRAFQRRMDVVVPFFPPRAEERFHILQLHLPIDHRVGFEHLREVASRCRLNGGQIRNLAFHATLLATDEQARVGERHLDEALRSEYRKAGASFPLEDRNRNPERDGGMEALVNALSSQY